MDNDTSPKTFWSQRDIFPDRRIAYFSMEIALSQDIPTYSGGLGVLAGDTLRSAADLEVPILGVTLLSERGYFFQRLGPDGAQYEEEHIWDVAEKLLLLPVTVSVTIEGREVKIRVWEKTLIGVNGHPVPIYFLDTNLPENTEEDRAITARLYGGDDRYRLHQEVVLGIGGLRALQALDYPLELFHMNEGHSALLVLELMKMHRTDSDSENISERYNIRAVKRRCVFTTHTPVPAGHDRFHLDLVDQVLGDYFPVRQLASCFHEGMFNLTLLALQHSRYINGVAKRHGQISRAMFAGYDVESITNGVHSATWICEELATLFDRHLAGWRVDPFMLRYVAGMNDDVLWDAHQAAKDRLLTLVKERTNIDLPRDVFTIGFARRITAYKRLYLLFNDVDALRRIHDEVGPFQILLAGKAHPRDYDGKELIRAAYDKARQLGDKIQVVFLENYDMDVARYMTAGVDLWVNTPKPPLEASGTSGMKAAHNGIPSLSVLDGWWIEGHIEGLTGWSIDASREVVDDAEDNRELMEKLRKILPLYYGSREDWCRIIKSCIALNGSFFNTHRMVQQYVLNAYFT